MSFIRRDYKFNNSTSKIMAPTTVTKKFSTISGIRKILKPILRILKMKRSSSTKKFTLKSSNEIFDNNLNSSLEDMRKDCAITEEFDNNANEALEKRLLNEIGNCKKNDAIYLCNGSKYNLIEIDCDEKFIPVHFVRTNNGTFFWTSTETTNALDMTTDSDSTINQCNQRNDINEHHLRDRWVQA